MSRQLSTIQRPAGSHIGWVAIGIIGAVSFTFIGMLYGGWITPVTSPTTDASVNPNFQLTSTQTGSTPAYEVKISNVTENNVPDPAFTLAPGNTLLLMDISIKNLTGAPQELVPVSDLFVRDNEGDTFPLHPALVVKNPLPSTKVAPGQTVSGQISFEVPKKLARPLLYVDMQWSNLAPIVYDVMK
jgi:hypothetical protein